VSFGGVSAANVRMAAFDEEILRQKRPGYLVAVIGNKAIFRKRLEINSSSKTLWIDPPKRDVFRVMDKDWGVMILHLTVNGQKLKVLFDTGLPNSAISSKALESISVTAQSVKESYVAGVCQGTVQKTYDINDLRLFDYVVPRSSWTTVETGPADIVLGIDIISQFDWYFDLESMRWDFTPNRD